MLCHMLVHYIDWLACNNYQQSYFKTNYSKNSKIKYLTTTKKWSRRINSNFNIAQHTTNHSSQRWFIIALLIFTDWTKSSSVFPVRFFFLLLKTCFLGQKRKTSLESHICLWLKKRILWYNHRHLQSSSYLT